MLVCPWEDPRYFIFSSNVPDILYYSHIPAVIVALLFGIFVFFHSRTSVTKNLLLFVSLFSFYTGLDLVIWASNRTDVVLFLWSLQVLVEPLIFLIALYISYFFLKYETLSLRVKALSLAPIVPFILLISTKYNLSGIRLMTCDANEGLVALYYSYILEISFTVWIIILCGSAYRSARKDIDKKRIKYFGIGMVSLLLAFSWGNIVGSFTEDWVIAQYGLFGMPVFIGFLAFLIVRYKAFDVKLIGVQVLVVGLILLIGSQFFFAKESINLILIGMTLFFTMGFGFALIRSVQREIKRKEELQVLTQELATANQELKRLDAAKSEFISIASHQLRTPITAIKGYVSLVLEGSYGNVIPSVQDILNKVYVVNNRMSQLVEDLLSISRIESGRVQYNFTAAQLEPIVADAVDMFALMAKQKGLSLKMRLPKKTLPKLSLDVNKIREVISNLIDNAIKYTKEGGVTVTVEGGAEAVLVRVEDTGIGIASHDIERIFEKFTRSSETMKLDVSGTGLGLFVGKNFMKAHGGTLTVVSLGQGRGTCFTMRFLVGARTHLGK